jgi:Protein kinase domain
MPLHLFLLLLILISLSGPVSHASSPFSTFSISTIGDETLVCALLLNSPSPKTSDLICKAFPSGREINYSSEGGGGYDSSTTTHVQYSAVATADDFLCGIMPSAHDNISMMWWSFDEGYFDAGDKKRVYQGPLLALSAGDSHVCGLTPNNSGSLECWRWKELDIPRDISFKEIAVGGDFVCGITSCGGWIKCFGEDTDVVGKEPTDNNFTSLAAGSHHVCAVSDAHNLTCWGSGAPKIDPVPEDLLALSLGTNTTCILISNHTVRCWGRGVTPPNSVAEMQFISIVAKGDSVCGVLMSSYSVLCWGSKNFENCTLVYDQILPGTCAPEKSCQCGTLDGSANICSDKDHAICEPCKITLKSSKINVSPPSPYPIPTSPSPPSNPGGRNKNRMRSVVMIVGIASAALASSVALAGFVFYKVARKKERSTFDPARIDPAMEQPNPERPTSLLPRNGFVSAQFTFRALHRATDGFAEGNKIGSGGFGTVYWGVLPDGRQAALKRAHCQRRRHAERAFFSELALLSRLNHKNLVGLMGFCEERGERILVVEYMPNGTLYDHLHRLPPSDTSPLFTSWTARLSIALDAARGIEYLHSYAVPGIIHRDIKSSNILLDGTWTAKVSDFGLSMIRSAGAGSAASAGTFGYMDPEYYRFQELTEKSDVYSFGVVLLEMLTGLKAVFKSGADEPPGHVTEYVMSLLNSDDTSRIFDERVPLTNDREEEAVNIVVKLAAQCVRARGKTRPTMREVVMELEWAVGLCSGDDEDTVEVVLEVEERGSAVSSTNTSARMSWNELLHT